MDRASDDGENTRPQFGNRLLTDPQNVFQHNAWDNVVWDEEQEEAARSTTLKQLQEALSPEEYIQSHTERHRFRSPPSAEDSSRSSVSSPSHPSPSDLNLDLAQPGPSTGASQAHCQPGTSHGRSSASPGRSSASPGRSGPSPGRSGASPGRSGRGRKRRASWMSDPPQWILDQTEVLRQIAGTLDTYVKLKQDVLRRLEDEDKN